MKKLIHIMYLWITVFFGIMNAGCSTSTHKVIYCPQTEKFLKAMDFDEVSGEYKIADAVIHPFFRDLQTNEFSGHLGAFAPGDGYEYMRVFDYKLKYTEMGGEQKEFAETVDKKIEFKNSYRGDLKLKYPYAGMTLFSGKVLVVDKTKPTTLKIDVLICRNGNESQKSITYNLKYREDKYLSPNIKGW